MQLVGNSFLGLQATERAARCANGTPSGRPGEMRYPPASLGHYPIVPIQQIRVRTPAVECGSCDSMTPSANPTSCVPTVLDKTTKPGNFSLFRGRRSSPPSE